MRVNFDWAYTGTTFSGNDENKLSCYTPHRRSTAVSLGQVRSGQATVVNLTAPAPAINPI